jgi:hypothetical protein
LIGLDIIEHPLENRMDRRMSALWEALRASADNTTAAVPLPQRKGTAAVVPFAYRQLSGR